MSYVYMQYGICAAAGVAQVHYSVATWCCAAQRDVLASHVQRVLQVVLQAPAKCCAAQCGVLTRHVQQILPCVLQAPASTLHPGLYVLRVLSRCT